LVQIFLVGFRFNQNIQLLVAKFQLKTVLTQLKVLSKDDNLIAVREKIEETQAMFRKFARHDNAAA